MSIFINELDTFQLKIKGKLQSLLPNIRSGKGGAGESKLVELLTNYTKSPFNYDRSFIFLKTRAREIEGIDYILTPNRFKEVNVKVLDYEKAVDVKILFEKPYALILKFSILPDTNIVNEFMRGKIVDEGKSWFNTKHVVAYMGKQFKWFLDFAANNMNSNDHGYIVLVSRANESFVSLNAYKEGRVLTNDFPRPDVPNQIAPLSNSYNSLKFSIQKPSNPWITHFDIKYWKFGRGNFTSEIRYPVSHENTTVFEVKGLSPNEIYQFGMRYVTLMGNTAFGPVSSPVYTRPCSPPTNLRIKDVSTTSFAMSWDPPVKKGPGVQINAYKVTVIKGDIVVRSETISQFRHLIFNDLSPATVFDVSIQALTNVVERNQTGLSGGHSESLSSWIKAVTEPDTPSQPCLINISYHIAGIRWSPPSKIADGAIVYDYRVKYVKMNNFGNETMIGSNMILSAGNKTSAVIKDLTQGTTYGISVKIVTSLGSSTYSSQMIVKTKFDETDLDRLQRSLKEDMTESLSVLNKTTYHRIDMATSNVMAEVTKLEMKTKFDINAILNAYPLKTDQFAPSMNLYTSCGSHISSNAMVKYPSHGEYSDNLDCYFYINTGEPTYIRFTKMDLEESHDYVKVYDDGTYIASLTYQLPTIYSEKGSVRLWFHTDSSVHYSGFAVEIRKGELAKKWYYPEYRATFINYGKPTSFDADSSRQLPTSNDTISDCLHLCHGKYVINKAWNGVGFDYQGGGNICTCYQRYGSRLGEINSERFFFKFI